MPDIKGRHDILKLHLRNVEVADGKAQLKRLMIAKELSTRNNEHRIVRVTF